MPFTIDDLPAPTLAEPSPAWITNVVRGLSEDSCDWLDRNGMTGLYRGNGQIVDDALANLALQTPAAQNRFSRIATDVIPYEVWAEHREMYTMHPQMSRDLSRLKAKAKIPAEVFERLRHPNPLFVLPAALPVQHLDGRSGRIVAFLVTGCVSPSYPIPAGVRPPDMKPGDSVRGGMTMPTHPFSKINALHVMTICEVHNADGTLVDDFEWTHFTLPTRGEFVLEDLAREALRDIDGISDHYLLPSGPDGLKEFQKRRETYTLQLARVVVSHLLYACSRTAEISRGSSDRPPAARGKKGKKPPKPSGPGAATDHKIGFRIGAAIQDSLRRINEARKAGIPTGATMPPHIRGAHSQLYRVGPGRKEIDIIFKDPFPVNAHLDDGRTATLHEVR